MAGEPPPLVGLRVEGFRYTMQTSSTEPGDYALVDFTNRKPLKGSKLVARLPEAHGKHVGFGGAAWVMRGGGMIDRGLVLGGFQLQPGGSTENLLLINHDWLRHCVWGTVVGFFRPEGRRFHGWTSIDDYLDRMRGVTSRRSRLVMEAATFPELRDRVAAAARVYNSIGAPSDLMDRSFPRSLARPERREYQQAVRWARSRGLKPRELAAVGGDW